MKSSIADSALIDEELIEKFSGCMNAILDSRKVDSIVGIIQHLEDEKDIPVLLGELIPR